MSQVRKTNSFQEEQMYFRIRVISGIFWTMSILGAIFEYIVIDYVFIALCSLQGLFVAVAQLTTRWIRTENRDYRRPKSSHLSTQKNPLYVY
jgi:lipid-A-disaccharide synthase-like uncharacterized protein